MLEVLHARVRQHAALAPVRLHRVVCVVAPRHLEQQLPVVLAAVQLVLAPVRLRRVHAARPATVSDVVQSPVKAPQLVRDVAVQLALHRRQRVEAREATDAAVPVDDGARQRICCVVRQNDFVRHDFVVGFLPQLRHAVVQSRLFLRDAVKLRRLLRRVLRASLLVADFLVLDVQSVLTQEVQQLVFVHGPLALQKPLDAAPLDFLILHAVPLQVRHDGRRAHLLPSEVFYFALQLRVEVALASPAVHLLRHVLRERLVHVVDAEACVLDVVDKLAPLVLVPGLVWDDLPEGVARPLLDVLRRIRRLQQRQRLAERNHALRFRLEVARRNFRRVVVHLHDVLRRAVPDGIALALEGALHRLRRALALRRVHQDAADDFVLLERVVRVVFGRASDFIDHRFDFLVQRLEARRVLLLALLAQSPFLRVHLVHVSEVRRRHRVHPRRAEPEVARASVVCKVHRPHDVLRRHRPMQLFEAPAVAARVEHLLAVPDAALSQQAVQLSANPRLHVLVVHAPAQCVACRQHVVLALGLSAVLVHRPRILGKVLDGEDADVLCHRVVDAFLALLRHLFRRPSLALRHPLQVALAPVRVVFADDLLDGVVLLAQRLLRALAFPQVRADLCQSLRPHLVEEHPKVVVAVFVPLLRPLDRLQRLALRREVCRAHRVLARQPLRDVVQRHLRFVSEEHFQRARLAEDAVRDFVAQLLDAVVDAPHRLVLDFALHARVAVRRRPCVASVHLVPPVRFRVDGAAREHDGIRAVHLVSLFRSHDGDGRRGDSSQLHHPAHLVVVEVVLCHQRLRHLHRLVQREAVLDFDVPGVVVGNILVRRRRQLRLRHVVENPALDFRLAFCYSVCGAVGSCSPDYVIGIVQETGRSVFVKHMKRSAVPSLVVHPRLRVIQPVGAFYAIDALVVQHHVLVYSDKQRLSVRIHVLREYAHFVAVLPRKNRVFHQLRQPRHRAVWHAVLLVSRLFVVGLRKHKRQLLQSCISQYTRRASIVELVVPRHPSSSVFFQLLSDSHISRVVDAESLRWSGHPVRRRRVLRVRIVSALRHHAAHAVVELFRVIAEPIQRAVRVAEYFIQRIVYGLFHLLRRRVLRQIDNAAQFLQVLLINRPQLLRAVFLLDALAHALSQSGVPVCRVVVVFVSPQLLRRRAQVVRLNCHLARCPNCAGISRGSVLRHFLSSEEERHVQPGLFFDCLPQRAQAVVPHLLRHHLHALCLRRLLESVVLQALFRKVLSSILSSTCCSALFSGASWSAFFHASSLSSGTHTSVPSSVSIV